MSTRSLTTEDTEDTEDKKMKTHTPGPWAISGVGHSIGIAPDNGKSDGIAHVFGCGPQAQADAKLVAACPDLLDALDSCLEIMLRAIGERLPIQQGTGCEETDWLTAIRKAKASIAKAT
jgi:hypothetical protein